MTRSTLRQNLHLLCTLCLLSFNVNLISADSTPHSISLNNSPSAISDFHPKPRISPSIPQQTILLRAWGVPSELAVDINSLANMEICQTFPKHYPYVQLQPPSDLLLPYNGQDILPLMQIAADISPAVIAVNFRQSHTYIENKFLYPLDKYIEQTLNLSIPHAHKLTLDQYLKILKSSPKYQDELEQRVPEKIWKVMRRKCPYGENCPYLAEWGELPDKNHEHIWCFPEGAVTIALFYRKDLFADAGLPDRVPKNWDELLEWSRKLTNPKNDQYGLQLAIDYLSWSTLAFL